MNVFDDATDDDDESTMGECHIPTLPITRPKFNAPKSNPLDDYFDDVFDKHHGG